MPNGSGDGLAGTVTAWSRAIAIVGIPGAIAIWLTWIGAQTLPQISRVVEANRLEILATKELIRSEQVRSEAMYRMLQRICSNTARTEDDRQRCFDR